MKEKHKTPRRQLSKVEIGNLHTQKKFRIMIVKMIQDLGKRMEEQNERIYKKCLKKN